MKLNELKDNDGAHKLRMRVGRGPEAKAELARAHGAAYHPTAQPSPRPSLAPQSTPLGAR